eukprot:SAG31_NODE_1985_length_6715_cov_6.562924_11_plen_66_part_00
MGQQPQAWPQEPGSATRGVRAAVGVYMCTYTPVVSRGATIEPSTGTKFRAGTESVPVRVIILLKF